MIRLTVHFRNLHCFLSRKSKGNIAQNRTATLPDGCLEVFWMLRWQREMRIEPKDKEEQRDWNIWNNFQTYIHNKCQEVGKSLRIRENSHSLVNVSSPHTSPDGGQGPSPSLPMHPAVAPRLLPLSLCPGFKQHRDCPPTSMQNTRD